MSNHTIFILLTIISLHTTSAVSPLITNVCKRTKRPNFCTQLLSGGGDMASTKDLEFVALRYVLQSGQETQGFIERALENPKADVKMRVALVVCKADYRVMLDYVKQANEDLKGGRYYEAEGDMNWIRKKVDECSRQVEREGRLGYLREVNGRVSRFVEIGEAVFKVWFGRP